MALTEGLSASMRAIDASISSTGEISLLPMRRLSSTLDSSSRLSLTGITPSFNPTEPGASEDQPRLGLLIERPDRPLDARVLDPAIVAGQRRVGIDVDHLLGDGPEGRHEVVGRLDDDDASCPRVDAQIGEQLESQGLRTLGDEHDLDAADAHRGTVAERNLRRPEALPAVARHPCDGHHRVDRRAGRGADLAAEAEWESRALTGIEAQPHRNRVPDRPNGRALDVALDQVAQDAGVVGRRAAAGVIGGLGDDDGRRIAGDGHSHASPISRNAGIVLPRMLTSSWPRRVASRSALALSPSAITSTRLEFSGTSA